MKLPHCLLTFLLILSASPIARADDAPHAETSQEKAEKGMRPRSTSSSRTP